MERGICPIAAVSTVVEILSLKYIHVASLTLRVTWVTSSVTWPHDSLYLISYRVGQKTHTVFIAITLC